MDEPLTLEDEDIKTTWRLGKSQERPRAAFRDDGDDEGDPVDDDGQEDDDEPIDTPDDDGT